MSRILQAVTQQKGLLSVYADRGYDAGHIRNCLRRNGIGCRIPYRSNSAYVGSGGHHANYNKTGFAVERFFAWLKNGFHRTRIRYESMRSA
jgi:transposase